MIVDDEYLEREGIKFLIDKYKLDLEIAEAYNGEKALKFLVSNPVDILFTDIKMPFMDGLELAEKARSLYPEIKIIIFSAYGEFDYAKKAIDINVVHYILKPIQVKEFLDVFTKVIDMCKKEKDAKEQEQKLIQVYNKAIENEKEKLLIDLMNGVKVDEQLMKLIKLTGKDFTKQHLQMVMVDFRTKFFDQYEEDFKKILIEILKSDYLYVNLNERQSVIFILESKRPANYNDISKFAELLINKVESIYSTMIAIVISGIIDSFSDIDKEYDNLESMLDYKFFFDNSIILFTHKSIPIDKSVSANIERLTEDILSNIDSNDYCGAKKSTNTFFDSLKDQGLFSVVFIKFICSEIVKKAYGKTGKNDTANSNNYIEEIFRSETLNQLKSIVERVMNDMRAVSRSNNEEANKKVIKEILNLVEDNYMNDISLEWMADKVFLSPSYLSNYFKKETGKSFVKYITSYRLERARDLLQNTNMKIVDISEKVGYCNTSYFCLNFKNHFGISPTQYREKEE